VKKGPKSAGAARQYRAMVGKLEHCQLGVFLACASATGHALSNRFLSSSSGSGQAACTNHSYIAPRW
jgi:SRSO17 transposase